MLVTNPRIQNVNFLLPGEFELLYELRGGTSLCPGEFGNGRSHQNNSANLQRLALRGLVERTRYGWYRLTAKGRAVVSA